MKRWARRKKLGPKLAEDFAAASAHGWGADLGEFFGERTDLGFCFWIRGGEIGERLHGEGFHDAAFVAEIVEENFDRGGFSFGVRLRRGMMSARCQRISC